MAKIYLTVKVRVKRHTFSPDEFIFKDKRGKSRSTQREDWGKIMYNEEPAWKYRKYICFEDIFD